MHLRDSLNISALVLVPWQHINLDFFLFLLLFFTLTRFEPKKKIDKFIDWLIPTQLLKIWVIWKKSNWFFFCVFCFEKVEPEGTCQLPAASKALFLEKVRQSNAACQNGDFATSVALYTDALSLDPANHILYSNRSAALVKMGRFEQALQDAIRARELNSQWPKVKFCIKLKRFT